MVDPQGKEGRGGGGSPKYLKRRTSAKSRLFAILQGLLVSIVSLVIFFGLLEAGLSLFSVEPSLQNEDPFVGFASNVPLFVEKTEAGGRKVMETARNRLAFFNLQKFPVEKAPGTRRIFCLGGSTTYGRPYSDDTSFAGWLREFLPEADPGRRWEVINAGGISYASYRVAHLMQELVRYQPDLFIVYTGHNEFLEERSYGNLRDIPGPVKSLAALLARTRTWTAMSTALDRLGIMSRPKQQRRVRLSAEVSAILDRSIGPQNYHRDDRLQRQIIRHYRISLERMVDIARSAGAKVLFVTPASNLRDCSPFKSEHAARLGQAGRSRVEKLLAAGRRLMKDSAWSGALVLLDEAVAVDPGFAESQYMRGKALLALGRYDEAEEAFIRARDEDVCPLRALTPMVRTVAGVGREKDVPVVDFVDLLSRRVLAERGYRMPGADYFLDHVHPTIEGNRILAVAIVQALAEQGIVHPSAAWNDEAILRVAARVEGGIDREEHALALVHLSKVLGWAGKIEDADRLAEQALASGVRDPKFVVEAAESVASLASVRGDYQRAAKYYKMALDVAPRDLELHFKVGLMNLNHGHLEKAAAHVLLVSAFWKENDYVNQVFGKIMARRGRFDLAYPSMREALRLNPRNQKARAILAWMRDNVGPPRATDSLPAVILTRYPSGMPKQVVQRRPDAVGRPVNHGILAEWYQSGELKRYAEYEDGVLHGVEMTWDRSGQILSAAEHAEAINQ